ncbi:MAG TPA: glycosyl hydrolase [Spirochaetia bacterium]|nr:glycosyl hydrolase [Spirochaetia bacterium]
MSDTFAGLQSAFRAPGKEHRPLQIIHGFDRAAEEGIDRYLTRLVNAGLGGIVTNVSFKDYLQSPEQWDLLRRGMAAARRAGLTLWIYDEDGYPSGAAGGLVLDGHPELEALAVACERRTVAGPARVEIAPPDCSLGFTGASVVGADATGGPRDVSGNADSSGRFTLDLPAGDWTVLYFFRKAAYEGTHAQGNVHASRRYINVLEPRAARRFLDVTHEAYRKELGPDLGGARSFFTDEPSLMSSYVWPLPPNIEGKVRIQDPLRFHDRHPMVAWSEDFPKRFQARKRYDILPRLACLFVDAGPDSRKVREDYREVVAELFADSYFGVIGDWCREHGVESSGHLLVEESLLWHAAFLGDLFTPARRLSIPGIDMLDSDPVTILGTEGFMVPKQVSSAAHLEGRSQVMSECSDWAMRNGNRPATPAQIRGTYNLLYLLGVTVITSYYAWEEIGADYAGINEHAGRLRLLLGAGRHDATVAVLYPIRGVWGRYLAQSEPPLPPTQPPEVRAIVADWTSACRELLTRQVDFDCLDERAVCDGSVREGALRVGLESYNTLVIPPTDSLAPATREAIARMAGSGVRVIVLRNPVLPPIPGLDVRAAGGLVMDLSELPGLVGTVIPQAVRLRTPNPAILCARHLHPEAAYCWFLVNTSAAHAAAEAALDRSGSARLWDPATGSVSEPVRYSAGDWLPMELGPYAGIFVTLEGA